ncbi:MAG: hypothetical protein RLZZ322_844, partial [Verrucomicrobiota bacterium]
MPARPVLTALRHAATWTSLAGLWLVSLLPWGFQRLLAAAFG